MERFTAFVTGGTGVLGRPTVRRLLGAGNRVRVLSRSAASERVARELGAEPVRGSLFEPASLARAMLGAQAVLHVATRIPARRDRSHPGAWDENNRIRTDGTRLLVDVALGAGIETLVYAGIGFTYRDRGAAWIDAAGESLEPLPVIRSSLAAEREVERFTAAGGRGVALRLGYVYAPEAASTRDAIALARRGIAALPGAAEGYVSQIRADDAAAALVAAMERAPAGTYDVVDDEPLTRRELARVIGRAAGRRWLLRPPRWAVRLAEGQERMFATRSLRISNRRFREATGWSPAVPSAREGWARIAEALRASGAPHPD